MKAGADRGGMLLSSGLFFSAAMGLASFLPLWLDEILQLMLTRQASASNLIAALPGTPGAVPLAYLLQHALFRVVGYSAFTARLPSACFVAATVFVTGLLARELGSERGWLAALLFACFPLTLRYGTEARVYGPALFFSASASLVYARMAARASWPLWAGYTATLLLAIYTQPFAAFVAPAHILWSVLSKDRRSAFRGAASLALVCGAFLPWYLWAKADWLQGVAVATGHFAFSAKTVAAIVRELAGGGYVVALPVLALCSIALLARAADRANSFLVCLIVVPLACALLADRAFDYFIAARQFLWILPALAILAAKAVEQAPRFGMGLAGALVLVSLGQDARTPFLPREDWHAAALAMAARERAGECLTIVPAEHAPYYRFFDPGIRAANCRAAQNAMALTPYSTPAERSAAIAALQAGGYKLVGSGTVGQSTLLDFRKASDAVH